MSKKIKMMLAVNCPQPYQSISKFLASLTAGKSISRWERGIVIMSIKRQWTKWSTWSNTKRQIHTRLRWLRNKQNSPGMGGRGGSSETGNLFPCPRNSIPGNDIYGVPEGQVTASVRTQLGAQCCTDPSLYSEVHCMGLVFPLCVLFPTMLRGCLSTERPAASRKG